MNFIIGFYHYYLFYHIPNRIYYLKVRTQTKFYYSKILFYYIIMQNRSIKNINLM